MANSKNGPWLLFVDYRYVASTKNQRESTVPRRTR